MDFGVDSREKKILRDNSLLLKFKETVNFFFLEKMK